MPKKEPSLRYIKTAASVSLFLTDVDGKKTNVVFTKADDPHAYQEVADMVDAVDREGIISRITRGMAAAVVPAFSGGEFDVDHANRRVRDLKTGTDVGDSLARRIIEWHSKGMPFEPLLLFHRRVIANPSKDSARDLYAFLDANDIPLTQDGRFIGYKRVTRVANGLTDSHTRTISNTVGTTVSMPREQVDPDRNHTCAPGLHVGAWEYVRSFTGDVTVEVLVDPADVVAVPPDYRQQKMRTCRYVVLREMATEEPRTGKLVKVDLSGLAAAKGAASIEEPPNFEAMTAREIKAWAADYNGTTINIDNKNKRAIVKRAYTIFSQAQGTEE